MHNGALLRILAYKGRNAKGARGVRGYFTDLDKAWRRIPWLWTGPISYDKEKTVLEEGDDGSALEVP